MDSDDQTINNPAQTTTAPAGANPQDEQTVKDTLKFLNTDILELMGAQGMSPEQKDNIYKKMMHTIQNRVLARVLDDLPEEKYEELKKILAGNDEEEFAVFYQQNGINLPQLYAEEALLYKIEMVNLIKNSTPVKKDDN